MTPSGAGGEPMSEIAPGPRDQTTPPSEGHRVSYPVRLGYAVYGALQADMGCLLGAIGFVVLIALSVVFAAQLTPCTSAGGIPCAL